MERFEHHTEEELWIDTEHSVAIKSKYDCEQAGLYRAWAMEVGNAADFLIQLCPWYMEYIKLEEQNLAYITPDALNDAKAWYTNPPPWTLDTSTPQIEYFVLLDSTILHEVCITAVSCTNEGRS